MTYKNRIAVSSLLRAEGFFCSLDVLFGGLGIGTVTCNFFYQKNIFTKFSDVNFCQFLVIKMLDLDPDLDLESMNTDPKHWLELFQ